MTQKLMEVPRSQVRSIQDGYCCAACWNSLMVTFTNDMSGDQVMVDCGTADCPLPGFVSANYVESRLNLSISEAIEAKKVLSDSIECGWLRRPRQSVAEALAELGF